MPRTISTKPEYSVRWWRQRELLPPDRDAFDVLRKLAQFRLSGHSPSDSGEVVLGDSRTAGTMLQQHANSVSLIVTSPPYLDTTDYAEDQWLRLWFLGGPERPTPRLHRDDRHTSVDLYWSFLKEVWQGIEALMKPEATIVIRIGGTSLSKQALLDGLRTSLSEGLGSHGVFPLHDGVTSAIKRRQTNSFRPGTSPDKVEHDFAFSLN